MDEQPCCRICLESEGELFRPCLCNGSMKYIHLACLEQCRRMSQKHMFQCDLCHYQYKFSRVFWHKFFTHTWTNVGLALTATTGGTLSTAFCLRFILRRLRRSLVADARTDSLMTLLWWSVLGIGSATLAASWWLGATSSSTVSAFRSAMLDLLVDADSASSFLRVLYAVALAGFAVFVVAVYRAVRLGTEAILQRIGSEILRVND